MSVVVIVEKTLMPLSPTLPGFAVRLDTEVVLFLLRLARADGRRESECLPPAIHPSMPSSLTFTVRRYLRWRIVVATPH